MLDEKAVQRKIKSLEDDIKYLKVGYETLADEIKQIKIKQSDLNDKVTKIAALLGI